MLEKIKTFVKAQIQKIPPWWKIYYNLCNEFYRPAYNYLLVRFALWFERVYLLGPLEKFKNASLKNRIIMALKYILSVSGIVSLGTFFLVATGLAAPAVVPQLLLIGIYFGLISPIFVNLLANVPALIHVFSSRLVGAIAIFITELGVYADNENALLAKAELVMDKKVLREFYVNEGWGKTKALYTRSEELGNPDAHNLLVDHAAALLMRDFFPQSNQQRGGGLDADGYLIRIPCPYQPLELDENLKKEAFEKMIHRRYVKNYSYTDPTFLQLTSYYEEDNNEGLTPMMHAVDDIRKENEWDFLVQAYKNKKIAAITNLLALAESLPIKSQAKMLSATFNDGRSVLDVLLSENRFSSNDFIPIRERVKVIIKSSLREEIFSAESISTGKNIGNDNIKKVVDYILNYCSEVDHELITAISKWQDEECTILYNTMSAQENLMAQEMRERIMMINENHQKNLMEDEQSVHLGGKDEFKNLVRESLKKDFKTKNNREINDDDIEKSSKEFKEYIDALLKKSQSKEDRYTGPSEEKIKEAITVYDYIMRSESAKEMMVLVWMAVQETDKLTGSHVDNPYLKGISENLKESIISAMSDVTRAYSLEDKASDLLACIPGTENGLALVLNHYYAGFEFNDGFEKVGDIERIRDGSILIDKLKQKVIETAKDHAENDTGYLIVIFLCYLEEMAFNDERSVWQDFLDTSLDAIWKEFPLSRSQFLSMWVSGRKYFSINPLMLFKPEFDLEAQYIEFCKTRKDYDSLRNAIFCTKPEMLIKEFSDFSQAPPLISDNMEDILPHGLQFVDKEKLKNMMFDYEKHYIDFCESIISKSEDEVSQDGVNEKYSNAIRNPGQHLNEFSEYLKELNLTVPEYQKWQLENPAIIEALIDLERNPVELKKLQWGNLAETEEGSARKKYYQDFLEVEYLEFCKSLDEGDLPNFEKAVNRPRACIQNFEAYLAQKHTSASPEIKWVIKGHPVSFVLAMMNANSTTLQGLKESLLKYERENHEKEHEEVIKILSSSLAKSNSNLVFSQRSADDNSEVHPIVNPDPNANPRPRSPQGN
jgi:hypothetical protein